MPRKVTQRPEASDLHRALEPYAGRWEGDPADSRVDKEGKFARARTQMSLLPLDSDSSGDRLSLTLNVIRITHYIDTLPEQPFFRSARNDNAWIALSEEELLAEKSFTMEVLLDWNPDARTWNACIQGVDELYVLRSSDADDLSKGGLVMKPQGDQSTPNNETTLCIHPVEIQASPHGAAMVGFFATVKDFLPEVDYTFVLGRLYPIEDEEVRAESITCLGTPFEHYMKRLVHRGVWSGNIDVVVHEPGGNSRPLRTALELAILPHQATAAFPDVGGPHRIRVVCFLPIIVEGPPKKRRKKTSSAAKCRNVEDMESIEGIMDGVMGRRGSKVLWCPIENLNHEATEGKEVWLDLRTLDVPGPSGEALRNEEHGQYTLTPPSLFVMWTGSLIDTPIIRGALMRPQGGWVEFGMSALATGLEPDSS